MNDLNATHVNAAAGLSVSDEEILHDLSLPEDFNDLARACGVPEDSLAEVRARSLRIIGHRRRDGADTFAFGDDLVFVEGRMRGADVFRDFATETYGYDTKYIARFIRVSVELAAIRRRCIKLSMSSTQLVEMLPRTSQEREEILAKLEGGEKVTVAQIKNWGRELEEPVEPLGQPGRKGLMAIGQAKLRSDVATFTMTVGKVLARIEEEFEPVKGRKPKAIVKKKLNDDVKRDARIASGHLVNLACGLTSGTFGDTAPVDLPEGSGWRRVQDVVYLLGRGENEWPSKGELRSWLVDEVLSTLRWSIGDAGAVEPEQRPAEAAGETAEGEVARIALPEPEAEGDADAATPRRPRRASDVADAAEAKKPKPSRRKRDEVVSATIAAMAEAAGITGARP